MDNHSFVYVYIDTVSPVREQFFRLALTSIRIQYQLLDTSYFSIIWSCFKHFSTSLLLSYYCFEFSSLDFNQSICTFASHSINCNRRIWSDEMPCGYARTSAVRIRDQVSCRAAQRSRLLSKSPAELCSGVSFSRSLPQICAEVSGPPKFDYSISQISKHPECTSITAGAFRNT